MDNPLFLTISELSAGLQRQEFSAVDLARTALDRLASFGRDYNAVASILPERALKEAHAADRMLRDRRDRGALLGIPYGAKDLLAARGAPTTWGAPPYARQVFNYDAAVIESLRRAGAVLVARLAMIELAGGGGYRYPSASLQGPCRNPWNPDHWSGGSSSGTGAAVAAGLTPFGLGSETSGSILSPSANCGVTGLRPTYGLVSRHGAMALAWTMDKIGPMCRSAEDCGLVLEAIAGVDPRDPGSAGRAFRHARGRGRNLRRVRVGYLAGGDCILAPWRLVRAVGTAERVVPEWRPGRPGGSRVGRGRARRAGGGGSVALIPAGNLAGLPGLSLPCGFSTAGLPVGVQLVGRPFEETTLIGLGRAYQTITSWHRQRPPMGQAKEAGRAP